MRVFGYGGFVPMREPVPAFTAGGALNLAGVPGTVLTADHIGLSRRPNFGRKQLHISDSFYADFC